MPSKGKNKELPARYPRTKEILIFPDMSELDHVVSLLDQFKDDVRSTNTNATKNELLEMPSSSVLYVLIDDLKKACFEYERFWIDQADWNPEKDESFDACLSDPDELRSLVIDLDFGRVKPVKGKNIRFHEPAYHAAARSLQLAMLILKYPGGWEFDYCIDKLKYFLTRYHVAALEIAIHRANVYLSPDIDTARKMRARSKQHAQRQKNETKDRMADVLRRYDELIKNKKPRETKTSIVQKTALKSLISEASVWKYLSNRKDILDKK